MFLMEESFTTTVLWRDHFDQTMKSVKRPVRLLNEPFRKRVNNGWMDGDKVKQQLVAAVVVAVIIFFDVVAVDVDMLNTEHVAAILLRK